ncbi:MAG: dockerin type I repeat-containing protein, partial [Pirellulales bacterium]
MMGKSVFGSLLRRKSVVVRRGLGLESLEPRGLFSATGLGVFAVHQAHRTDSAPTAAAGLTIHADDFQLAASGRVLLKIDSLVGASGAGLTQLSVTPSSAVPQTPVRHGGLLAHVVPGSYTLKAHFGLAPANTDYQVRYRLAGDVDGSFAVTADDLDLIRTGIQRPATLTRPQFANADVDGDGAIRIRDLELATANLGASTTVRPLELVAGIDAGTPSHNGVVRLPAGRIAAGTSSRATVIFANAATGERLRRTADLAGKTTAAVRLRASADNSITVTAEDSFGQRVLRRLTVRQRPTPVVIVPGWATSMPRDPLDLPAFLTQLGYPAEKLAATNLLYGELRHSLAVAGYQKGRDQFVVPY